MDHVLQPYLTYSSLRTSISISVSISTPLLHFIKFFIISPTTEKKLHFRQTGTPGLLIFSKLPIRITNIESNTLGLDFLQMLITKP